MKERVTPHKDKLVRVEAYLREMESALRDLLPRLESSEHILRAPTPTGPEAETANIKYVRILLVSYAFSSDSLYILWFIYRLRKSFPAKTLSTLFRLWSED